MTKLDIAIVGASCRLPQAPDLSSFSDLLFAGRDAVTQIPQDRWSHNFFLDPDPKQPGKAYTFAAGVLDAVDRFDAGFFGMSPREAITTDPQQRLLLELAFEAMEDAGIPAARLAGEAVGVFVGGSAWDYGALKPGDMALMEAQSAQGMTLSSMSNRISYAFNLKGPSLTVDTACSSAMVALHLACQAMARGEAQAALVGGVNLLLSPHGFVGFSRASMLSPTGRCHAFDARADGYVRAEGGGVLLLKPLAQALADGDPIRAVIQATGVNSDGRTNGMSVPNPKAQAALLHEVYDRAGLDADDLTYLEAHGTGTAVGDPIEAWALGEALGRRRQAPLPIGSVKTNIGHLEAASGMAGLLKVLAAFERGAAPRSLYGETPNPNIDFEALNLALLQAPMPLAGGPAGVLAGINSFGFGGTNAHAVLAAPPATPPVAGAPGEMHPPLLLSARSEEALAALAGRWAERLAATPSAEAAGALVRGAARRRDAHPHRLVVQGADPAALASRLQAWSRGEAVPEVAAGQAAEGGLAFVFSGNGSQWAGMGRDAYASNPAFRDAVDRLDAALTPYLGWSVAERFTRAADPLALRRTDVAQPLLFALQAGVVAALRDRGIEADAYLGHSVGEVAAALAAGALTLDQACRVIAHRSRLQQTRHGSGGMAVLGLPLADARAFTATCDPDLEIAAVNSPGSVTVAGPDAALRRLARQAKARGAVFSRLDLDYAFHSAAMEPLRAPLLEALGGIASAAPAALLVSTMTAEPVTDGELDAGYWWRNVRDPVRFADGIQTLLAAGRRLFVEIGPQPTLQSYLRAALKQAEVPGAILGSLAAQPDQGDPFADIAARIHVAGRSMAAGPAFDGFAQARGLPAYPWDRQRYWLGSTSEAMEVVNPREDHPLLGFRRDPERMAWVNHLTLSRFPWLIDHQVDGSVVLPAAAMIDMALAAARARDPEAATLELRDVEIFKPVLLDEARTLSFSATAAGAFELSSRARLSNEPAVSNVAGRLNTDGAPQPLFRPSAAGPGPSIDADAFYARIAGRRMQYGPAFRPVVRAQMLSPETSEVEFATDADADAGRPGWLIDPARLDGAFQAILATKSLDWTVAGDSVLPWRFGRIRLLRRDVPVVRARCERTRVGPKAHCFDIALFGADGAIVAELLECWFVRVRPGDTQGDERAFHTALVPTPRQPAQPPVAGLLDAALAGLPHAGEPGQAQGLAHAYAVAAAWEAVQPLAAGGRVDPARLTLQGRVAADGEALLDRLLAWLAEEGLATQAADVWELAADPGLPPSAAIWQSLLLDHPALGAEAALAGGAGSALAAALAHGPAALPAAPEALLEQMLFSSPSGAGGLRALAGAAAAAAALWPQRRPLRIAVLGDPPAALIADLVDALGLDRRPVLLAVATADERALPVLTAAARAVPGAAVHLWRPAQDPMGAALGGEGFDLVLGAYAFARGRISSAAAAGLLAPGGLFLALEPEPSRLWSLALGLRDEAEPLAPAAWAERLALFGCIGAEARGLGGDGAWPAALVVGERPALDAGYDTAEADGAGAADLVLVLADPRSPLADALAEELAGRRKTVRLPLDALQEALGAEGPEAGRDVMLIAPPAGDDAATLTALPRLCAALAAAAAMLGPAALTRLWVVIQADDADPSAAALAALRRVMTNEGADCRFVRLDPGVGAPRLAAEVLAPGDEREIVLTGQARLAPRLRLGLPATAPAPAARRLDISRPGLLNSLVWEGYEPVAPGPGEVAIAVRAAGLNFRDVMWALGVLPDEALLDGFSGPTLGLECAGVVTAVGEGVEDLAVGDRVAAVAPAALSTAVLTRAHAVTRLPDGMDFAAGATLPVTGMTVLYALGRLADLQPGERVLIHGALGGVGLAALQYARHRGAEVFATAGSPMKRDLLGLLGVEQVFDSRTTGFADQILRATGGEGVDVVLNSLSGELMQESLRLLKPFGRFLEIGKRDLFRNTEIGLRPLRKNVSYFAIDADQLPRLRPALAAELFRELGELIAAGAMRPLPYRAFGFDAAVEAFRLMQGSGHVGKIVLVPEPWREPAPAPAPFRVRADRTYVISGGTAGFGLETGRWLADRGARSLALLGRRGRATPELEPVLQALADRGVAVQALACDVADAARLEQALATVRRDMAPIGGVVHAAMVMDDSLLAGLDAGRFARSLAPKLAGAAALDLLTRADPVELFVVYSSISAAIGNPGQGNYVAANAAAEAVVARRRRAGLPGLAVQWGPISDAGYLLRESRVREVLERVLASGEMGARSALDSLDRMAGAGPATVGQARVGWSTLKRQIPIGVTPLFADMADALGGAAGEQALKDRLADLPEDEAREQVMDLLSAEVSGILRLQRDKIDVDKPIADMGFDSLMALELRLAIEARLGQELPLLSVGGGTTLRAIATRIVRTAQAGGAVAEDTAQRILRHEGPPDREVAEAEAEVGA